MRHAEFANLRMRGRCVIPHGLFCTVLEVCGPARGSKGGQGIRGAHVVQGSRHARCRSLVPTMPSSLAAVIVANARMRYAVGSHACRRSLRCHQLRCLESAIVLDVLLVRARATMLVMSLAAARSRSFSAQLRRAKGSEIGPAAVLAPTSRTSVQYVVRKEVPGKQSAPASYLAWETSLRRRWT